jgi:nicotinamidase-related amidase
MKIVTVPLSLCVLSLGVLAGALVPPAPVQAQPVTDDWSSVRVPDPPEFKAVTVDPKTTALVVMDFNAANCVPQRRARCATDIPRVVKLLGAAREHKLFIVFTSYGPDMSDLVPALAPQSGEAGLAKTGPDKFLAPTGDLQKMLKDKGIATVIMAGTAANGALIQTASAGALRGFKVIVPLDTMPGDNPFAEAYTAWHLTHAPTVSANTTLTKVDSISFSS